MPCHVAEHYPLAITKKKDEGGKKEKKEKDDLLSLCRPGESFIIRKSTGGKRGEGDDTRDVSRPREKEDTHYTHLKTRITGEC